jgi:hypothetical protein
VGPEEGRRDLGGLLAVVGEAVEVEQRGDEEDCESSARVRLPFDATDADFFLFHEPISTVLYSSFIDFCIFVARSSPSILFATGPSLEHHLLVVRELASTKVLALKITKALSLVRSGGSGQPGPGIDVEVAGAAGESLPFALAFSGG